MVFPTGDFIRLQRFFVVRRDQLGVGTFHGLAMRELIQSVAQAPRERMLLAGYYVDQLTLAEIGRTLGEHESTVSRQLDRMRRQLRESVTETLLHGAPAQDGRGPIAALDEAQVELAFEYALEDWPFDLSRALSNAEAVVDPPEK